MTDQETREWLEGLDWTVGFEGMRALYLGLHEDETPEGEARRKAFEESDQFRGWALAHVDEFSEEAEQERERRRREAERERRRGGVR